MKGFLVESIISQPSAMTCVHRDMQCSITSGPHQNAYWALKNVCNSNITKGNNIIFH